MTHAVPSMLYSLSADKLAIFKNCTFVIGLILFAFNVILFAFYMILSAFYVLLLAFYLIYLCLSV
jgi:hypothetical protein